jgi:hypothetical protein
MEIWFSYLHRERFTDSLVKERYPNLSSLIHINLKGEHIDIGFPIRE